MVRLFLRIYDFLRAHVRVMWGLLIATVVLLAAASATMSFKEDVTDFLPSDAENRAVNWAFSHIGAVDKVVLTLDMEESRRDEYLLMDAVDTLEKKISEYVPAEYLKRVMARVDDDSISEVTDFIVDNLPYYLTEEDYERLDSLIAVGTLDNEMLSARSVVASPIGGMMRDVVLKDPLMLSSARLQSLQNFQPTNAFSTVDDYIFTDDGAALVTLDLAFSSSDTWKAGRFIKAMDEAVSKTEEAFSGEVTVDPLGSVYIAYTNSSQIKRDSILSILIAVVLIAVLLISFFKNGRSILLVGVTILYGFLMALGLVSLIKGSVSLIVIGLGAVIIGIAANYPLHFLSHIRQGYSPRESLSDIVLPLTTGNITTVGAFLSLLFIASPAMQDLGLFAALLLVGTILFTLVFLPHLVKQNEVAETPKDSRWDVLSKLNLGSRKAVLLAVVVISVVLSFFDDKVKFDTNLHNINYMTERQKANMGRMLSLAQGHNSITYVTVMGDDIDSAIDNYLKVADRIDSLSVTLPGGASVSSIRDFVPSESLQKSRLARWNAFVAAHGQEVLSMVNESAAKAGFKEGVFEPFRELLDGSYEPQPADHFAPLTDNVASGCLVVDTDHCAVMSSIGTQTVQTAAIAEILDDPGTFVVFDSSTMTERMVSSLSREFDTVLYVCAFIVFLLLVISFGRLELALIAFLPLTLGWIWILGMMSILGIDFNIVNIILATFIFGMGDDYTIFIVEGLMYEHTYGRKMLHTYERTIILSALIMFVGIGSLIVAKHPAMLSLSYVIMIGMFSVVLMAVVVPPFLYRLLTVKKGRKRKEPLTLVNFFATVLAFIAFLIGALIVTLAGFFLITLTGGSKKGKYLYHCFLCKVSKFIFNNVFFTRHTVECTEKFDTPAIIVANHQSHLDLMALLQLTPKMIVVTNKWVWNNPFYGILIRYADFCPVDNVLTDDLTKIEQKIAEGYSVLVFPEGTRTLDGSIGRFHRGAFYLAEQNNLDILPVVLHGVNDVLPKEDLLLRKGHMSVKVLPRISPSDTTYGADYRERSKGIRHLMMDEFDSLASSREDAGYFTDRVIHNYIYKGAEVARTVLRNLRSHDSYAALVESLPEEGRVAFKGLRYGEQALICALVRKHLQIEASIEDEMDRLLADNCVGRPSNLKYVSPSDLDGEYDMTVTFDNNGGYEI